MKFCFEYFTNINNLLYRNHEKKFNGKLKLNKEVISTLDNVQLRNINGGLKDLADGDASNIRCTGDLNTCSPCDASGAAICKTIIYNTKCIAII